MLNDGNPITSALSGGNIIYNNTYAGTNNNDLVNINDPAGPDSLIMTADDGFALQPGSNAINYGNNTYIYPGDSAGTDITGGPRIKQLVVDAGAYEDWGCLGITTLYVDAMLIQRMAMVNHGLQLFNTWAMHCKWPPFAPR